MKELAVLLVALAVVVAGVYLYFDPAAVPSLNFGNVSRLITSGKKDKAPEPKAEEAKPPAPRRAKRVSGSAPEQTTDLAPALPEPAPLLEPQPVPVPAPPKPKPPLNPDLVATGMSTRDVVDVLGKPTLTTVTIADGILVETYVYVGTRPGEFTRVQFENGRVVRGR